MSTFSIRRIANVYIAASSAEIDRAQTWREKLALAGINVVSTWIETIQSVGDANPREAARDQRKQWANCDLGEIRACDLLWFLVPPVDKPTRGAWIEVGFAHALGTEIVASGDVQQSIFLALGDEYETDREAFAAVVARLRDPKEST